jgi:hypothetical protein
MDHDATREQLELAALEPDGLDRLMAGDTATAQAVAGHLAGCPACADELVRLQRASSLIRGVVRGMPPPELRERTLATVAAIGVPRPPVAAMLQGSPAMGQARTTGQRGATEPAGVSEARRTRLDRRYALGWVATIAAAVILSVLSTGLIVGNLVADQLAAQSASLAALGDATIAAMSIAAQPDATLVTLRGSGDPEPGGRLSYSPSTSQLVLVARGLAQPVDGQEYRAWVEVDGKRQRVGRLTYKDGVAYWSGEAPAVAGLAGPARFGVSLVNPGASGGSPPAVILGEH